MSALNYCQTAAGSRLLRSNILEPSTNREAINRRLDAVKELVSRPTDLHQPIKVNHLCRVSTSFLFDCAIETSDWRETTSSLFLFIPFHFLYVGNFVEVCGRGACRESMHRRTQEFQLVYDGTETQCRCSSQAHTDADTSAPLYPLQS